ncbi:MAG: SdrD B-like domain-containing protein, partial [Nonlabens sp.]|uniref:SdrD B-like domain-containing protein n=1 Tax=Nonlabens sp. TaxID=1888209 RepID=UPI003264375A
MSNSTFLNVFFSFINKTLLLFVIILMLPLGLYADGTKQVMPSASNVEPVNGTALYFTRDLRGPYIDAPQANRLHFTIANAATENLYFGVKALQRNTGTNNQLINAATYYRIYNQAGVLVEGVNPAGVQVGSLSGRLDNGAGANPAVGDPGYIDNYAEAFEGPNGIGGVTNGYNPLVFNPVTAGDFYIEFYISGDGGATSFDFNGAGSDTPVVFFFPYFDLTVGTTTTPILGRLWSEKWSFIGYRQEDVNDIADGNDSPDLVPNPTLEASVEGEFYAYTDDEVIVELDFLNGFRPLAYELSMNRFGVVDNDDSAANVFEDTRRSQNRPTATAPVFDNGYQIFLFSPDQSVFATTATSAPVLGDRIQGCPGDYRIPYTLSAPGDVAILIDLNGTPGFQAGTRDVSLEAFDQTVGDNEMFWNGLDGFGDTVAFDSTVSVEVTSFRGRTNIPMYDAEFNINGLNIRGVSPVVQNANIYWDDTELSSFGVCVDNGDSEGNNVTVGNFSRIQLLDGMTGPAHAWNGSNPDDTVPALSGGQGSDTLDLLCDDYGNNRVINSWFYGYVQDSGTSNLIVGNCDADNDGIDNIADLDDDNDGIKDVDEGGINCVTSSDEAMNTIGAVYNSRLEGPGSVSTVSNLFNGTYDFQATLVGNAAWAGEPNGGIRFRDNVVSVEDYIFVQPINTGNPITGNYVQYEFIFNEPVTNLRIQTGGYNVNDYAEISADLGGVPVNIDSSNFGNFDPAISTGVWTVTDNRVVSTSSTGGVAADGNFFDVMVPEPVDRIVFITGKNTNGSNTSTVTLGFTAVDFCVISTPVDTDNDGVPDYLDLDADNDGIYDVEEAGHGQTYVDGALTGPVGTDGIPNSVQASGQGNSEDVNYTLQDSDSGSGEPDWRDTDSDNDGCSDANEAYFDSTADGGDDGQYGVDPAPVNADNGLVLAASYALTTPQDSDGNGIDDYTEIGPDIDGNGIADACFAPVDTDGDGVYDSVDLDDDNDGILDVVESQGLGDPSLDDDGDGIVNYQDADFCTLNANGVCTLLDSDNDGLPNHLDLDSDGDGCSDTIEAGYVDAFAKADEDGILGNAAPETVDSDGLVTSGEMGEGYTSPTMTGAVAFDFLDPNENSACSTTLDITKTSTFNPATGIINYTYTVLNSGSNFAFDVSVTEDLGTFTGSNTPVPTPVYLSGGSDEDGQGDALDLIPGETIIFTASYEINDTDFASGQIDNQATASATDSNGDVVSDISDDGNDGDGNLVNDITETILPIGSINGHVYNDLNGNGTQDLGEPNLANVDVILTPTFGDPITVSTDVNGDFEGDVYAGDVRVDIVNSSLPTGAVQTEGTDPTTVTAVSGTTVTEENNGFNIPATLQGLVYNDVNGNGTQDVGEPGISNVDILITDQAGNAQTVTTDSNGAYMASIVAAGIASVDIVDSTLPTGAVQTEGTDPTNVTVVSGTTVVEEDNGFNVPGVVEGHVYNDINGNGTQDAGEADLSGVDVLIADSAGVSQTVTTDANGDYTANVAAPGTASVDIVDSTLPTGAVQTEGTDPTSVTVVSGTTVVEEDNGFNVLGVVEGHVYNDINGNGTQDAGEADLSGVDVLITDSAGVSQTVTTDANGDYTVNVA